MVCVTVMDTVPEAEPDVAVMVAEPPETAVLSPPELTLATPLSLLDQLTEAPVMAWPFWSLTVADSWTVAPMA
jgi:hypothetical protein